MLEFEDARRIILEHAAPTGVETVPLTQALGRVLARDAASDADIPVSDNSAMDGYAVRAADVQAAAPDNPVRLEVLETIAAGSVPTRSLGPGQCSRIMTGAVMPKGADAVVMVEDTARDGDTHTLIHQAIKPGKTNMRFAGEDVKKGDVVLRAGRVLRAADLGMLAATGHAHATVARRPVVGILSTGDEIIQPHEPLAEGKVRNSNTFSLFGQILAMGAEPRILGVARDTPGAVESALSEAARECDMILTSGGVSMGEFDEVKNTIEKIGELIFWQVRMKPGKPLTFGKIQGVPVVGLPGNPVSVMVGFEIFIRPALLKMMNASEIHKPIFQGALDEDIRMRIGKRLVVVRAIARLEPDGYHLNTTGPQGSGILSSMVLANALAFVPAAPEPPGKGDSLDFFFID